MNLLLLSLIDGVIYGTLLFLVSAGLTLVFGMMRILNFAHASFYMLGAYLGCVVVRLTGFWIALLVAPIVIAALGIAIERVLLRPAHRYGHGHELLMTFGIALVIEEAVKLVFGNFAISNPVPPFLQAPAFSIFGIAYPAFKVLIVVVAATMFAILFGLLLFTRLGILVRAAVHRPEMVGALGHNVPLIFLGVFGIGAWLAGVAGVVGGMYFTTNPNMANELGIIIFVVVVVGGLGSVAGAFVASFLIGCATSIVVIADFTISDILGLLGLPISHEFLSFRISSFAATVPILIMLIVLFFRPSGIMGEPE